MDPWVYSYIYLERERGDGLRYLLCSPLLVEVIKRINLTNIFQVDPNHQLEIMILYIIFINRKCVYIYIDWRRYKSDGRAQWKNNIYIYTYICLFQWIDWPQLQRNDMGRTLVRVMKVNASYWLQKRLLASDMTYSALGNGQMIFQTFLGGSMLNHLKWANIPLLLKSFLRQ